MWRVPEAICSVASPDEQAIWVLPLSTGRIHALDPVAELIWTSADGADSSHDVIEHLVTTLNWDRIEITPHVEALIAQLINFGLIEKVPAA